MGWFWADSTTTTDAVAKCPVNHGQLQQQQASGCPVKHESTPVCPVKHESTPVCPVNHDTFINPSNNMPFTISSEKAPGQKIDLPKERTLSSIPRGANDDEGVWEYPSPQQMLNAMLRKGKGDIPEDAVESMVDVHNWLNEAAWREILEWEKPYIEQSNRQPRLLKFIGKPQDLSPRARMYLALSKVFPDKFNENPPFDRHDWTILRPGVDDASQTPVRYVIDYYGGPDDEDTGMPTFYLDVRPALDSIGNATERFNKWQQDVVKPTINKALGR